MIVCKSACAFKFNETAVTAGMRCVDCGSIETVIAMPGSAAHALVILRRQLATNHNHVGVSDLREAWAIVDRSAALLSEKFKLTRAQLRELGAAAFATLGLKFV